MNINRSMLLSAGLVAATTGLGVFAYLTLPAGAFLPYHQGFGGAASGQMPKGPALALVPFISAVVIGSLSLAPRLRFRGDGLERSSLPFGLLMVSLAGVLLVTEGALALRMQGAGFNDLQVVRVVALAVAVLLVIVGNYLGKVRHNFVFGLRTPWTLANPRVWDKTHRLTGLLMVLGGLVLALGAAVGLTLPALIALIVLGSAGPMLAGAIYSRVIFPASNPR